MDDTVLIVVVIAAVVIGAIALIVWLRSRGKHRVTAAVVQATAMFNLKPVSATHPDLDEVWIASRGLISGVPVTLLGGMSRGSRNPGLIGGAGAMAAAVELPSVTVLASFSVPLPFQLTMQRRPQLSVPTFSTGDREFDKTIEVKTRSDKAVRALLHNSSLRNAILGSLKKSSAKGEITDTQVMIRVVGVRETVASIQKAVDLVQLLTKHVSALKDVQPENSPKR
ncbi:MAG TPA: hypothetical protein DGH68_08920 [Bacteroidetes bacterium]|jgi:hypothetical protein|nr:hypothetical protein [Bacteroidota bacterium]